MHRYFYISIYFLGKKRKNAYRFPKARCYNKMYETCVPATQDKITHEQKKLKKNIFKKKQSTGHTSALEPTKSASKFAKGAASPSLSPPRPEVEGFPSPSPLGGVAA